MATRLESPTFNSAQIAELNRKGAVALNKVETDYGSGYLGTQLGRNPKSYHTLYHSVRVAKDFERMAVALGLTPDETAYGIFWVKGHDAIQDGERGDGEQERQTAEYLAGLLRTSGYFEESLIKTGDLIIDGTVADIKDDRLVGQEASRLEYPSAWAEKITKGLACSDAGEIHSAAGPRASHDLFRELNDYATDSNPLLGPKFAAFQESQIAIAQDIPYVHPLGEQVFGALRRQVTEHHINVLDQFHSGQIEEYRDVAALDNVFRLQYGGLDSNRFAA
jgi:hypothetical protein